MAGAAALGLPTLALGRHRVAVGTAANSTVRLGVIGMGDVNAVGGVGGRGHQLIAALAKVPGQQIVALCDADTAMLDRETAALKKRGLEVTTYTDLRKLLENPAIDAVVVALPNHWHSLATIWACQAGKDVYVEKPFSYNIWEGRQALAAARKYGRMVQVGTQSRSSPALQQAFAYLRSGQLGPIRSARAIVYRPRLGLGKAGGPPPVPPTLNLDLWCGPASTTLPARKQLHYDWHWFWETGNGEVGNNGIHAVDVARWALGQCQAAPRAIAVGGRFAYGDDGETANTLVAVLDYRPAPLVLEVRNLRVTKQPDTMGTYRGRDHGVIIDCEGGYYAGDSSGGTVFDRQGRKIPVKEIPDTRLEPYPDAAHLANFLAAVRSRCYGNLAAEAQDGYASVACCHMANVSYRLGKAAPSAAILDALGGQPELYDAFERCRAHLQANGVDLAADEAALGAWVTFDTASGRFLGEHADEANRLSRRVPREPFAVPEIVA
jgi:predicted dehydrogenase